MDILLVSTYELGRQPFGLASPVAWLEKEGFSVSCIDAAIDSFPAAKAAKANLIAFYVPMHTAARLAIELLQQVKKLNPTAHICFYGLYAPMNETYLRRLGVNTILGGEFEQGLTNICKQIAGLDSPQKSKRSLLPQTEPIISLQRQIFILPNRNHLPVLSRYAQLLSENNPPKITGYTETTRGCKYSCRHCPIVPVYQGRFRVIPSKIVLADIRQQVKAGAEHITFGDPDFLNGPGHVLPIVEMLHQEFPQLTYDVTIKIEHLIKYDAYLPVLRDTGCIIITSAVEAVDDQILTILDKGHSRKDFIQIVERFYELNLNLNPTFVSFTPWTSLAGYRNLLLLLNELNLIDNISPIQLAIRLLIPEGSKLLELPETQSILGKYQAAQLSYQWEHPDKRMDELYKQTMDIVSQGISRKSPRRKIFEMIWKHVNGMMTLSDPLPKPKYQRSRATIPYLNEPWYC